MSANQADFPIATMARTLGVSKAGYYAWTSRQPSAHAVADAALLKRIRTVHLSSRQIYGASRVHADLREQGERHSRKRIARLMRKAGLIGASHRRGGPVTTRRDQRARPRPCRPSPGTPACRPTGRGTRSRHARTRPGETAGRRPAATTHRPWRRRSCGSR